MIHDEREFRVRKFSYFSADDPYDLRFGHETCWSRIYEYPFALAEIESLGLPNPRVHNACWGHADIHLVFKTWLDVRYPETFHSDIRPSTLHATARWDVTLPPAEALQRRFDVVLNVSTLQEIEADHIQVLKNHLVQVRSGGRFIATFGVPGLDLERVEHFVGEKIVTPQRKLSPRNSRLEDRKLGLPDDFAVGYLVLDCVG